MFKSNDSFSMDGFKGKIGINNVIIFEFNNANIELWKDKKGYHVGLAYLKNGEEFRYKHFLMGEEPKKWKDVVLKIKDTYNNISLKTTFTNYI